jgi:hypothetical protein
MNRKNISRKLSKGIALTKREDDREVKLKLPKPRKIRSNDRFDYVPTCSFEGFDDYGDYGDFFEQLKSGNLLPDELYGYSTKTILAILLVLLVLKLKSFKA